MIPTLTTVIWPDYQITSSFFLLENHSSHIISHKEAAQAVHKEMCLITILVLRQYRLNLLNPNFLIGRSNLPDRC
ncbi:hypothetical protein E2C01_048939 [Portunus trituberculatus]|uniref:Uncharacterized protein n=1 Tax=Portunus trituberculatus TaxID=210409 RepID=A0A5B7GCV9_PORTR|nr:hypothetical protein [Portunus trituberculatus]